MDSLHFTDFSPGTCRKFSLLVCKILLWQKKSYRALYSTYNKKKKKTKVLFFGVAHIIKVFLAMKFQEKKSAKNILMAVLFLNLLCGSPGGAQKNDAEYNKINTTLLLRLSKYATNDFFVKLCHLRAPHLIVPNVGDKKRDFSPCLLIYAR